MSDLPAEIARLRRQLRLQQTILSVMGVGFVVLTVAAWQSTDPEVIRARGFVVEDAEGRARVVLGAPMELPGREAAQSGAGIAVLSETGQVRVAMGSPTPAPRIDGRLVERTAGSSGLVFTDGDGNERGGLGAFADGRANMCLDYGRGVKEAVCMFVFPNDQYAGITVNGHPQHGYERANLIVSADGLAQMKISAIGGHERAILRTDGVGPAELVVYDPATEDFVDVMPSP